jgi:NDP-sugar pyrophosphorylase family protein
LFDEKDRLCGWRNTKTGEEKISIPGRDMIEKAYSCVVVFEYDIFRLIPFSGKFSLMDVYLDLAKAHLIMGFDHTGDRFVDVGKPESVAVAEAMFP